MENIRPKDVLTFLRSIEKCCRIFCEQIESAQAGAAARKRDADAKKQPPKPPKKKAPKKKATAKKASAKAPKKPPKKRATAGATKPKAQLVINGARDPEVESFLKGKPKGFQFRTTDAMKATGHGRAALLRRLRTFPVTLHGHGAGAHFEVV